MSGCFRGKRLLQWAGAMIAAVGIAACAGSAGAGVIVIANRTAAPVRFYVARHGKAATENDRIDLRGWDVVPIAIDEETAEKTAEKTAETTAEKSDDKVVVTYAADGAWVRYALRPNSAHCFVERDGRLGLFTIITAPAAGKSGAAATADNQSLPVFVTIPVKLLVDEEEPAVRRVWERRLRQRLSAASDIFERHCRVRFEVVAVETWESDDDVHDFQKSLAEFEREVPLGPARVAIGFTSQYQQPDGRTHIGGTRAPLHSHVLIREWSQHVSFTERLEVLVHELGHYLGAAHSDEYHSVMRPMIGDKRSNARSFRIGFDPVNTMVLYLLAEELRAGRQGSFSRLTRPKRAELRDLYEYLAQRLPDDPAAQRYIAMLGYLPRAERRPRPEPKPDEAQ